MAQVIVTARCREEDVPQLPKNVLDGFVKKLEMISTDPHCGKPLSGILKRYRSIRLGRYRVIYRYAQESDIAWVVATGIRKEGSKQDIYEKVARLLRSSKIASE